MAKKVLLAIPQLTDGGAERVVSVWANELSSRGFDTAVLVFGRLKDEYYLADGIGVYSVAKDTDGYLSMSYPQRFRKMRSIIKQLSPDYAISFLPAMQVWMMLASTRLNVKRIETIRVNPWCIGITNPIHTFFWKLCYHTSYKIVLQSQEQGPFFSKRDQKKCVLVPNPISEIYVKHYKQTLAQTPTEFIAVGRLAPQKNYEMMINAFARVATENTDLRLRIFGTGSDVYIEALNAFIKKLNMESQIILMGRTPHMQEEYIKNDVFLMTSDFEGLPNALAEAMASRLICISTDCKTGPRDLIDDLRNGYLVPVNDADALTERIRDVLRMSYDEQYKMATAARDKILNYCSQGNSVNALCNLFK